MARTGGTVQGSTYVGGTRKHIGQVLSSSTDID